MVAPCRTSPESSSDLGLPLDESSSNHSQRSSRPTPSPPSMLGNSLSTTTTTKTTTGNPENDGSSKSTTMTNQNRIISKKIASAMSNPQQQQQQQKQQQEQEEHSRTPPSPPVIHSPIHSTKKTKQNTNEQDDSPPIPMQDSIRLPRREKDLEERVIELESQLATLSRLLQASQALSSQNSSFSNLIRRPMTPPMQSRNVSPPLARITSGSGTSTPTQNRNDGIDHDDTTHHESNHYPHLESPHPEPPEQNHPLGDHHRRLSHVILGTSPFSSPSNTIGRGHDYPPPAPPLAMHVLMEHVPPPKAATTANETISTTATDTNTEISMKSTTTSGLSTSINTKNGKVKEGLPSVALLSHPLAATTTVSGANNVVPMSSTCLNNNKESKNNNTEQATTNNKNNTATDDSSSSIAATTTPNSTTTNTNKDVRKTWLDYLNSYQDTNQDVDRQMEEFVRVPKQVEILLAFGFWICLDCFLYSITILPIRFVWSCCLGIGTAIWDITTTTKPATTTTTTTGEPNPYKFHRRHLYQVISVIIIFFVYYYILLPISIGKLYHWIRGQAMLKLYLLLAIVEVFDRLMCSLGQDCLDSLYWNTTRRPGSVRWFVSFGVVLVYATIHTWLLFVHVATLNVAMNSSDQALLSLLIGGNFAEIKSTVFKKYNKQALFKITTSDICERFKLALFLALVLALNMCQGMSQRMVYGFLEMCCLVYLTELFSDWIKHSFITKFNFIKSGVYPEYGLLLAGDVTGIGHEGVNLDHSHAVVKRIGLPQIPLVCVMARYLSEAARYLGGQLFGYSLTYVMAVVWCFLVVLKIISGSLLNKVAEEKLQNAPQLLLMSPAGKAKKKKD